MVSFPLGTVIHFSTNSLYFFSLSVSAVWYLLILLFNFPFLIAWPLVCHHLPHWQSVWNIMHHFIQLLIGGKSCLNLQTVMLAWSLIGQQNEKALVSLTLVSQLFNGVIYTPVDEVNKSRWCNTTNKWQQLSQFWTFCSLSCLNFLDFLFSCLSQLPLFPIITLSISLLRKSLTFLFEPLKYPSM